MATGIHGLEEGRRFADGAGRSYRLSLRRLLSVGATLAVVATAADLILATILRSALQVPVGFSPLRAPSVASMTIVGMISATAVFGWIARVRSDPRPTFVRIALGTLVLSWVPDLVIWVTGLFPATTGAEILSLMTLHVAATACALSILYRFGLAE
jgi:hypothetical protein